MQLGPNFLAFVLRVQKIQNLQRQHSDSYKLLHGNQVLKSLSQCLEFSGFEWDFSK